MTIADLESRLRGAGVSDVLLPGFIDDEVQPHQFRALPQAIYFECDSSLLKFETIATTGMMRVLLVDNVSGSIDLDDDMVPAIVSLREQVLDDADGSNRLLELRFWNLAKRRRWSAMCGGPAAARERAADLRGSYVPLRHPCRWGTTTRHLVRYVARCQGRTRARG